MSKRNTKQRRHMILSLLTEQGEVSVEYLSNLFDISEVTIRKDLTELEKNGLLMRKYGGAVLMPSNIIQEDTCEEVSNRKLTIAVAAVDLIKDHNRIIIDSGSTT
ncbi:MAG: DeoR/GlpR transcriptional regulator, partial [Aliivibrio sp.]|nr:DeoR/GlpR transcriptional regulator [Aliivibrio sp.]